MHKKKRDYRTFRYIYINKEWLRKHSYYVENNLEPGLNITENKLKK